MNYSIKASNLKYVLDTNILVYAYQNENSFLKETSLRILYENNTFISHFAYCEFLFFLRKRVKMNKKEALKFGKGLLSFLPLNMVYRDTYFLASTFVDKYDFQLPDSIIVADAFLNGCDILYSRDMQHNQLIEKKVRIINPFLT